MQTTLKMLLTAPFIAAMLSGCEEPQVENVQAAPAETGGVAQQVRIETRQAEPYGTYLTDAEGRSVYLFTADSTMMSDSIMTSTCYDDCAEAWPPVIVTEGELEAGEGVDEALLSTFERRDGWLQVTYNGWPLYYFARDTEPGQTMGQGVESFGGEWYLVSPEGEPIRIE